MKKQILLAFLFFFSLSILAKAQVRYGAKLGGNYTNLRLVHRESVPRIAGQIGALALIPIDNNDMFFVQPEVVYSMQGEYWKTGEIKTPVFLNYINVPIMAKFYFSNEESEFFVEGGPQFAFKIGDNIERLEMPNQKFKSFDLSFGLGLGYSITRDFEFNLRYNYGLLDSVEGDLENNNNNTSQLSFALAYILR
ncbi:porin family protein [Moheibacter sediminis]|uniref:Outer membrane protein beta-barrel domain-containing protein n=1 Tax=Moheibacter sediminis TaxID=1434700 RepID=A0A1W2CI59_9FLAO|nr:porin family protein [Moheibacter sediminis]SMC84905.1 Outer membrane protein beta-barrel domain-containing protein [Moheibacter sediminis]